LKRCLNRCPDIPLAILDRGLNRGLDQLLEIRLCLEKDTRWLELELNGSQVDQEDEAAGTGSLPRVESIAALAIQGVGERTAHLPEHTASTRYDCSTCCRPGVGPARQSRRGIGGLKKIAGWKRK
jgi:hypothetical protein